MIPRSINPKRLRVRVMKGKLKKEIIRHELPSSFLPFHPAFDWPKTTYGGNVTQTMDGNYRANIEDLPSIPKSWRK